MKNTTINNNFKTENDNFIKEENLAKIIDIFKEQTKKECYKIKLTKTHCYMPISDYRFEETIGTIIRNFYNVNPDDNRLLYQILGINNWMEKVNENISNPLITIGGYPEFIEEDPRSYENSEMTECLFKIDSNRNPNIIINDLGILNFVIKKSDITAKRFDKALLYSE